MHNLIHSIFDIHFYISLLPTGLLISLPFTVNFDATDNILTNLNITNFSTFNINYTWIIPSSDNLAKLAANVNNADATSINIIVDTTINDVLVRTTTPVDLTQSGPLTISTGIVNITALVDSGYYTFKTNMTVSNSSGSTDNIAVLFNYRIS